MRGFFKAFCFICLKPYVSKLSATFRQMLVPVGEENNLLNNTLWDLFFSNELKLLVLPSSLGREGERLLCAISAKDIKQ